MKMKFPRGTAAFFAGFILLDAIFGAYAENGIRNDLRPFEALTTGTVDAHSFNGEAENVLWEGMEIPYWKGSFASFGSGSGRCSVMGVGDSIIHGSGVEPDQTYFAALSKEFPRTRWENAGIPGANVTQGAHTLDAHPATPESSLVIWHLWDDDGNLFHFRNGVLYRADVTVAEGGEPKLARWIPDAANAWLVDRSFTYRNLIRIRWGSAAPQRRADAFDVVSRAVDRELAKWKKDGRKFLILLSPSLKDGSFPAPALESPSPMDRFYARMIEKYKGVPDVLVVPLGTHLKTGDWPALAYDRICHFSAYGHELVAKIVKKIILDHGLLPEECR